jgi:hypothetical protein
MEKYAIFTNEYTSNIDNIYNFLIQKLVDVCIITESTSLVLDKKYAILYAFYLKFYDGCVIFLNLEDYIDNYETTKHLKKYLLCSIADINEKGLDKSYFRNTTFIQISEEKVEIL